MNTFDKLVTRVEAWADKRLSREQIHMYNRAVTVVTRVAYPLIMILSFTAALIAVSRYTPGDISHLLWAAAMLAQGIAATLLGAVAWDVIMTPATARRMLTRLSRLHDERTRVSWLALEAYIYRAHPEVADQYDNQHGGDSGVDASLHTLLAAFVQFPRDECAEWLETRKAAGECTCAACMIDHLSQLGHEIVESVPEMMRNAIDAGMDEDSTHQGPGRPQ